MIVPIKGQIWTRAWALWPERRGELAIIIDYYPDEDTVEYAFLEDNWITLSSMSDFLSEFSPKISPGKIWKELNEG